MTSALENRGLCDNKCTVNPTPITEGTKDICG